MNNNSKWIWHKNGAMDDLYIEFFDTFEYSENNTRILISADSNYAIYLNGKFVNSGQYPDFPHYKVYDEIDITPYCVKGVNRLGIIVWYYGMSNMSYYPAEAALRYEVCCGETLLAASSEDTLSRISRTYKNGRRKTITSQLGMTYHYDLTQEDNWLQGELNGFEKSQILGLERKLHLRPIKKFIIGNEVPSTLIKQNCDTHYLFDLGRESAGYLSFCVNSPKDQEIEVCWGEHVLDGKVRHARTGLERDYTVNITLKKGENRYMNPFRRFGLRYLEVFTKYPIEIEYMTVCPTDYPLEIVGKAPKDALRKKIYDVSVRTLQLCMHDHYEDTPWREQALYAMDSRNQMLCGYYAFGEFTFPRACLYLMSQDNREDNLLSICFPNDAPLTIPSFSLHYFTEVYEYTVYSKDTSLIKEIYPKLQSIIKVFIDRVEDGLVPTWTSDNYWNFYEWSDGLAGSLGNTTVKTVDTSLNCLLVSALKTMQKITDMLGVDADYLTIAKKVNCAIKERLFDREAGCFVNSVADNRKSELVNALAILCGAVSGEEAEKIALMLTDKESGFTPATLSMICFKYDALLKIDSNKYKDYILKNIDEKYKKMLDAGATSFWETELGDADFNGHGSLCHAWSSMPIYYYSTLLDE